MKASICRVVCYVLSAADAGRINAGINTNEITGNYASEGDVLPMMICRVWDPALYDGKESVNGQVMLDGNAQLWKTSVHPDEAKTPGTWHWPERQGAAEIKSVDRMDTALAASSDTAFVGELAAGIYGVYCGEVGGKAFNGDPLPSWSEFIADPAKSKQSLAWMAAARFARHACSRQSQGI
jgi:hypothetical protein